MKSLHSRIFELEEAHLTSREEEVLHLISVGFSSSDIAESLNISTETVKTHRKHLFAKMGVNNMAVLIRRGLEQGLI